jgi:hypothetical protein
MRKWLLAALVVQIPFELRYTLLGLSNLQWTFVALVLASAPVLIENRKMLLRQRLVQAALVFVAIQWVAAFMAPEFHTNAAKAAVRFTAGLLLLAISLLQSSPPQPAQRKRDSAQPQERRGGGGVGQENDPADQHHPSLLFSAWVAASAAAAAYALLAYAGIGLPSLFRTEEFYIGQVQRLSGSFEYPNTAAAYFAMSLPIVWWSSFRPVLRWIFCFLLWCAVVLTFSKGALSAIPLAALAAWKKGAGLIALGIAAYIVLLPVNPYLLERLYGPGAQNPLAAQYTTPWNKLQQQPNVYDQVPLEIRNTGISKWRSRGLWRSAVAYRWWNMESETFLKTNPVITPLPHDVERGETINMAASIRTPPEPGRYLLVVELFSRNLDWFSQTGVIPVLLQVDVQPGSTRATDTIDLSSIYRRGRRPDSLNAAVPRSELWRAAIRMVLDHPLLGIGPDNYRLEYGKYLGAVRWDTHVYSNNLFLEILAGSGILGLAAFVLVLLSIRWQLTAAGLAIGIFLIHGLVDVFLMTTPIYFAFWLLAGMMYLKVK